MIYKVYQCIICAKRPGIVSALLPFPRKRDGDIDLPIMSEREKDVFSTIEQ